MKTIRVFVKGIPKAQPRARATTMRTKKGVRSTVYNPKTADAWKMQVKAAFSRHAGLLIEGPIRCDITFLMPRPKSLMRKCDPEGKIPHTAKPDRDNLDKSVMDCLSGKDKNGKGGIGVWVDDAQVYAGEILKYYHEKGGEAGAWVIISYEEGV